MTKPPIWLSIRLTPEQADKMAQVLDASDDKRLLDVMLTASFLVSGSTAPRQIGFSVVAEQVEYTADRWDENTAEMKRKPR